MTIAATTALAKASKAINRALRPTGWQLFEVAFNEELEAIHARGMGMPNIRTKLVNLAFRLAA